MSKNITSDILLAVIRAHCLECSGGSRLEVRNCRVPDCKLYPYRKCEDKPKTSKKKKKNEQFTVFDVMEALNHEQNAKI